MSPKKKPPSWCPIGCGLCQNEGVRKDERGRDDARGTLCSREESSLANLALNVHRLLILQRQVHVSMDWTSGLGPKDTVRCATYNFQLRLGHFAILRVALTLLLGLGALSCMSATPGSEAGARQGSSYVTHTCGQGTGSLRREDVVIRVELSLRPIDGVVATGRRCGLFRWWAASGGKFAPLLLAHRPAKAKNRLLAGTH